MEDQTAIKSLDFGTVFKIIFWSGACFWLLLSVLIAFVALVMPSAITINGARAASPWQAIAAAPIFLIVGTIMTSIFAVVGAGLLRLFGRYVPLGAIKLSK